MAINNGKQRISDNLPSLKFLCLRFHFPWDRLYYEKKLPFGITIDWVTAWSLRQVNTRLISSITEKSSKLRLLIFEIRGYTPRRCFTRGWSYHADLGSDNSQMIRERFVKYHIPEYEPMPGYARAVTWKIHCETQRYVLER